MFKLIEFESSYVSGAFDKIFVETKFEKDLTQIDQFGNIALKRWIWFAKWFESEDDKSNKVNYYVTKSKIQIYDDVHQENLKDSSNVNKLEFLSSAFTCDLSLGSEFSQELLLKMSNTSNTEIFRSNIILFLDYKWFMLRRKVYAY